MACQQESHQAICHVVGQAYCDSNGDGVLDISDPIRLLGRLFLGEPTAETCPLAVDVNADGALDISDPIVLLGFLFMGNMVIPPPNPGSEQLCP